MSRLQFDFIMFTSQLLALARPAKGQGGQLISQVSTIRPMVSKFSL